MIYSGKPLIFYLSKRQIKKPPQNMETEKTLIPSIHISTNMRPRLRQGPDAHYLPENLTRCDSFSFHKRDSEVIFGQRKVPSLTTALAVSRILRIGITPSPTLCAFFARLLSSSQSLDFLHIDFTTKILKSQVVYIYIYLFTFAGNILLLPTKVNKFIINQFCLIP